MEGKPVTKVLVLDSSYQPLGVVSARRAVTLVFTDKAEIAHESDTVWRSPTTEFRLPTVIRLLNKMARPKYRQLEWSKRGVMMRDGHVCQFAHCDAPATTIDHVFPTSRGGADRDWTNTIAACSPCNRKKADKLLDEIGWKLKRKPKVPVGLLVNVANPPEEWAIYIPELAWRFYPQAS